jgi:hypothetical protein
MPADNDPRLRRLMTFVVIGILVLALLFVAVGSCGGDDDDDRDDSPPIQQQQEQDDDEDED